MQFYKDNYVHSDENASFSISFFSSVGGRPDQQDSAGYVLKNEEGIVAVCDGMGGHEGGKEASSTAVDVLLDLYDPKCASENISEMLTSSMKAADKVVASFKGEDGKSLHGGTTAIAAVIRKKELYWASVGDSRIYVIRNGEIAQLTNDHVYKNILDKQLSQGLIMKNDYEQRLQTQGDALISFVGMGDLSLIDFNKNPFILQKKDTVILATDGLYKTVTESEIIRLLENFSNTEESLKALDMKARKNIGKNTARDNMTVSLIKIK